jgi:hypothetical protein
MWIRIHIGSDPHPQQSTLIKMIAMHVYINFGNLLEKKYNYKYVVLLKKRRR